MELKRIASFSVDHTKLAPGLYTSRIDGDVVTYDVRMKRPNGGDYLKNDAMHTIEHLFATYARSCPAAEQVVYVGPMGCLTGFYLLVRGMSEEQVVRLVQNSMAFISQYEGAIPGATEPECGNYKLQDLSGAKREAAQMAKVLENWTPADLAYPAYLT